ncbi:(4Fe-4S)-binding protein [Flavicella sp.]|uniref:(4Fe-4S)-binding protein n=1 Tax=Flavicella sp. TaxID=2957742 RepID=UPI002621B14D|nr:(4Fe-4S)-binding protein [Flavicella sp.]MDG1806100.1 (4Fe-4S)-binding protein [Flavicella sp.]MDG2279813.1 (4Fe-4S)-binding protein [Flavicella sp.]
MKSKEYSNGEITVVWQPEKCIHAGVCVKTLPEVYKPNEVPWVKINNATSDQLKHQVNLCPSGALSIK